MAVKTRNDPERAGASSEVEAAANLAQELISADQVLQWTLEGKCFTASVPVETDSISGGTDHSDTAQTYVLKSDAAGSKLIVPIATTIALTTTPGGGHINGCLYMTRPVNDCAIKHTFSAGTPMTVHNNRSDGYGTNVGDAEYTVTGTGLSATEMVELAAFHSNANVASSTEVSINDHTFVVNHLKQSAPVVLQKGATIVVICWAETAPTFRVTFQWAELDAATYLP